MNDNDQSLDFYLQINAQRLFLVDITYELSIVDGRERDRDFVGRILDAEFDR